MISFLEGINKIVWGVPTLLLILCMGVWLSVRTGFVQFRLLPQGLKSFFGGNRNSCDNKGVSSFRALCTALAATVGTGNLAGVAGAIAIGGPGSVFWMWIFAFLGMATKFAEATLAVRFRSKNEKGEWVGGPMHMIRNAMPKRWHWLAGVYSFFGIVASFGIGNCVQVNTVIGAVCSAAESLGYCAGKNFEVVLGLLLAVLVVWMLHRGQGRIGAVAELLVPFVCVAYLVMSFIVLALCGNRVISSLELIIRSAFSPAAVTGGVVGSMITTLRVGASRGVFTNEAGMGTASIAHAGADVDHPCCQGIMGIVEVFLDTVVICTLTALVILCSGIPVPYGKDMGVLLTFEAFESQLGAWSGILLTVTICLLALATILGWGLYGGRCAQYLFGDSVWNIFVLCHGVAVIAGSVLGTGTVWILAEIVNGLMAIPNLVVLGYLTPELILLTKEYEAASGKDRKPQCINGSR